MKVIQKISKITGKVLEVLIVYLLAQMTVLMFLQVLGRHLQIGGIVWAEELSRYSMITMVFFGSAVSCRLKDHIAVTFLDEVLKGKKRIIYKLFIALLSVVFLYFIIKFGFQMLPVLAFQTSANMRMPMNFIYAMIPVGGCIMLFYVVIEILELTADLAGKKKEK